MSAKIPFNEDAFVDDHVSGGLTVRQLAARHGLSYSLAEKILRGRRRPELARRIDAACDAATGRLARRLTHLGATAVGALERAMAGEPSSVSIAAAREVLSRVLDKKPPTEPPGLDCRGRSHPFEGSLMDLSPSTKRLIAEELGGPLD